MPAFEVTSTDVVWVDAGDGIEVYRVALGGLVLILLGTGVLTA